MGCNRCCSKSLLIFIAALGLRLPSPLANETLRFRWVDLQLQALRFVKLEEDLKIKLGHLPRTLEQSYQELFEDIQDEGVIASRLAELVFQWLLCAYETIPVDDFTSLVSLASGTDYTQNNILDVCANFVEVDDTTNAFRFVHLSVREFLESRGRDDSSPFHNARAHASLAKTCLEHIIWRLSTQFQVSVSIPQGVTIYADKYWPSHVALSRHWQSQAPLGILIRSMTISQGKIAFKFHRWAQFEAVCEYEPHHKEMRFSHPVWLAATYDIEFVAELCFTIPNFDPNMRLFPAPVGDTPLHCAADHGSFRVTKYCLIRMRTLTQKPMTNTASTLFTEPLS
jgi:hypothetical protein